VRMAGDVEKTASFAEASGVSRQCGRKCSQTIVAPAIAPQSCAAMNGKTREKSWLLRAKPRVTAGLICAPGLPQAMAVNTPHMTASAHPVLMTSQPEFSALD